MARSMLGEAYDDMADSGMSLNWARFVLMYLMAMGPLVVVVAILSQDGSRPATAGLTAAWAMTTLFSVNRWRYFREKYNNDAGELVEALHRDLVGVVLGSLPTLILWVLVTTIVVIAVSIGVWSLAR